MGKNKIKTLYAKDQKGAVAAISSVSGYLVAAIGQKIYLWQLKNDDLVGIAFIDTEIYIHQLLNIRSFILAADVYKSVSVLRLQEEFQTPNDRPGHSGRRNRLFASSSRENLPSTSDAAQRAPFYVDSCGRVES